jgi:5-hydroxyisourate hydrolase
MRRISTHILDLVYGKPASGVPVRLEGQTDGDWKILNSEITDQDGRCAQLLREEEMPAAVYRLIFNTGSYYSQKQIKTLYPVVEVTFRAGDGELHFHIALLLSPNGYTTYRGS